jgi:hypothetical protein
MKARDNPGNIQNRPLDRRGVDNLKAEFRVHGVQKLAHKNHMSASSDKENILKLLRCLNGTAWPRVPDEYEALREQLRLLNINSKYPATDIKTYPALSSMKSFVLQAGQHRFTALNEVYADEPANRWWPVQIYTEPLSAKAYTYIRENAKTTQLALSDGERFNMIMNIVSSADSFRKSQNKVDKRDSRYAVLSKRISDLDGSARLLMVQGNTKNTRLKSLLKRESLCAAIHQGIQNGALARDFSFGAMGDILAWRITDV